MRDAHGGERSGRSVDLRDLRYFIAVAETGNLSRAARDAHVAQPALSRRIRALERELGVALLTRHPKGVALTPAGASFAQESRQLLQDAAAALDRADATAAGRRGRVLLGAMRAAIARGFPTAVQESLRHDHPEVTIVVHDFEPPDTWNAVADGRADVAVCMEAPPLPGLVTQPLWLEVLDRAIVPRDHPLAARSTVSLVELRTLPFVVARSTLAPGPGKQLEEALRAAGFRSPALELEGDLRATHLAVAAGRGWTLMSRSRALSPPEGTAVLTVAGIAVTLRMSAVWRRGERRPVVQTVLRRMFDVARGYTETEVRAAPALPSLPRPGRARRPPGTVPPGVELRHLRALVTVAAAHTIGRAAARLGITQPALSRQLREVEHALGVTLLERSARGVALTPAGVSLAGDSPALLTAAERLVREASRARRGIEGRCVIGVVATAASSELLARVTERCAARYPDLHIVVEEMATPAQRAALARADIDLGLAHAFPTAGRAPAGAIVATRVHEDRLDTALLAIGHPLAGRRRIKPRELADIPFLFMERSFHPGFYDRLDAAFRALGLRPRVDATYDGLRTVWSLAAQGTGWALGFHSQLSRPPVGTVAVRITGLNLPFGLDLLSRRGESSPTVLAVTAAFREVRMKPRR
jgi:DNA-binding transcriptional LysR family regulator